MNRFKKWLIRKLGGYTEPWERQAFNVVTERVEPVTITASIISYDDHPELKEPDEYEQRAICSMLAEKIMQDKLYARARNPYRVGEGPQSVDYTLRVVPPPRHTPPAEAPTFIKKEEL